MTEARGNDGLGKHRIEALSDGIFAIAMTLLVLDLKVADIPEDMATPGFLGRMLLGLWPKFLCFAMSFLILGLFWIAHHGYSHFIKRSDRYYLWLNLLFLMVVVCVPFSADFLGHYPNRRIAAMVYGGNVMFLGITLYWQWWYATSKHRLVGAHLEKELIRKGKIRIIMGFTANGCAMLLALWNPAVSLAFYILFPIIYLMSIKLDSHRTHSHD